MKASFLILSLIFQFLLKTNFAQDTIPRILGTSPYKIDTSLYTMGDNYKIKVGDNENLAGKVMSQQFSNIVSGQSSTSIGNFASITPTEGKIDFAGSLIINNSCILTAKASGKATDGLLAIFNNSRLNTQLSLEIKYHFLNLSNLRLSFNRDAGLLNDQKVRKIKYEFDVGSLDILNGRDTINLSKKKATVSKEIDSLTALLKSETDYSATATIIYEIEKREILRDSISGAIASTTSTLTQLRNLHEKKIAELEMLSIASAVEGFRINWWTFGYKVNNSKFKLFYPTSVFLQQILDTNFVSHEVNLQWSYYRWNSQGFKTIFASLGAIFGFNDNFHSLDKREISETSNYGPTNGARSVTKKYDAYEGKYQNNIVTFKLYSDFYYFLFNNNIAALHFSPEWLVQQNEKPMASFFTGFLLSFKKKDDDKSIINAELYYQFLDLFKNAATEYKFFERNTVGLRFTFPVQFKYK